MVDSAVKGSVQPVLPYFTDHNLQSAFQALLASVQKINASPIVFGVAVQTSIASAGNVTLTHGLGRLPVGYFPISQTSGSAGFPTRVALQPSPFTTLVLTYSGAWTGSLWVF